MRLFFDSTLVPGQKTHTLPEEESKHACRVLRMKEGDELLLVNGKGMEFTARITDANPKKCHLEIITYSEEATPDYSIHLAIAPTKNADRIEWLLEKATEIGVTDITLLQCANNERKNINLERLEKILVSAMKQSKRLFLPVLHPLTPVLSFIEQHPNGLIAHCYEVENDVELKANKDHNSELQQKYAKKGILQAFRPQDCPVLIGPEGDFSLEEVDFALQNGYLPVSLGKNRLRTETAGLVAVMEMVLALDK